MVIGMLPPPERIGREGEHAAKAAEQIVKAARPEERAVTAIVLHDENPDDETSGRQGQSQDKPG